jgi:sulfonate transport system substrate-binding protein
MSNRSLILLLLLACVAGCGSSSKPADTTAIPAPSEPQASPAAPAPAAEALTVRIGYQKIGTPFLLKERAESLTAELGKKNARAEWIEFQAGPPIYEAIRAGALDIGYTGETPPVFAQAGGVPFVYIATEAPAPASEAILVPKDSKLKTVADLKGKKVALNRGSNVHYLLLKALEEAKLTLKDLQVTYLAPPDARAAFDSGQVDAWVIWDPFQAAAEVAGARILRDGTGLVDNQFFYVARREFAEKQAPLVSLVLEQFKTLSGWAKANPEETARILAKSSGISYDALLKAEKRHVYEVRAITPQTLSKQQTIADAFHALELIPQAVKPSEAYLASAGLGSGT